MASVGDEGVRIVMAGCGEVGRLGDFGRCGDLGSDTFVFDRRGGLDVDLGLEPKAFANSTAGDLAGFRAGMGGD